MCFSGLKEKRNLSCTKSKMKMRGVGEKYSAVFDGYISSYLHYNRIKEAAVVGMYGVVLGLPKKQSLQ